MNKRTMFFLVLVLSLVGIVVPGYADDEVDNYKWRVNANWWFSQPTGTFGLRSSNSYLDLDYKNGGFVYDVHMSGPLAGFAIRFK